jgi:hypothetical protein
MPTDLLRTFSKRADAIDGEVERLQTEGKVRTPKLVKWVVHTTRQAKQDEAPAALAERWRAEATQHPVDVPELLRGVLGRERQATTQPAAGEDQAANTPADATTDPTVVAGVFDRLAGSQGLTARASTFARPEVIAALGEQLVGAAQAVQDYRQQFQIDDPDRPLGEPARDHDDPKRHQAWREASGAIQRMLALHQRQQRTRDRDQQQRQRSLPEPVRTLADRQGGEPTSRHAVTRDPTRVQGAERAAG